MNEKDINLEYNSGFGEFTMLATSIQPIQPILLSELTLSGECK